MWSDRQAELSKLFLNADGASVKSLNGEFGVLRITGDPPVYTVLFYDEEKTAVFNSIDEMMNAGRAAD